jgi:hypothetical protein
LSAVGFPSFDERLPEILKGLKDEVRRTNRWTKALLAVSLAILALTCVLVARSF